MVAADLPLATGDGDAFLFAKAVAVPGFNHLLDNLERSLHLTAMSNWSVISKDLTLLCDVFCNSANKEVFVQRCIREQGYSGAVEAQFAKAFSRPAEWRWHTVADTLNWLLPLSHRIRSLWRAECFDAGRKATLQIDRVTSAIQDPFFWAYLHLVRVVHTQTVRLVLRWCEQCPCHPVPDHLRDTTPDFNSLANSMFQGCLPEGPGGDKARIMWPSCPMRGKRCPEVASGSLSRFVESAFEVHARLPSQTRRPCAASGPWLPCGESSLLCKSGTILGMVWGGTW